MSPADEPLIILASPRSFTSVTCAMLGQHPELYGLPEVNLFVSETMGERAVEQKWRFLNSGLLRAVAELVGGEQTVQTIILAQRWLDERSAATTRSVFRELAARAAPRHLVEKSPSTALRLERLHRVRRAFPQAFYLHLLRHPRAQGESLWKMGGEVAGPYLDAVDWGSDPPVVDMQRTWYRMHLNITTFLECVPTERWMRIRGEDLMADPDTELRGLAKWLGISTGPAAVEAMKHPERSPFAGIGPPNALLGNDPDFLRSPELKEDRGVRPEAVLAGPLPWRRDGAGFSPEVMDLARGFGYS